MKTIDVEQNSVRDSLREVSTCDVLEGAPDAIVLVNQSGKIVFVNGQAEKLFGYSRSELIDKPVGILVSKHFRHQHNDQHSRFFAANLERPTVGGVELFGLRKDGSEFPAEIRLSPLDTKHGALVSNAIRDISDRRRTEEDLRRLAMIVSCSDDAIIGKTLEGIMTSWNAAAERMFGYSPAEAIGRPVTMLVPQDRCNEIPEILERLKRGESVDHFETVRVKKDGSEIPIELTVSPIRDVLERIVGASSIGRDISRRKQTEAELLKKVQALGRSDEEWRQLAFFAADDLKEPLRMVVSFTQLLSKRYKGNLDQEADEFIAFAVDGARRIERMIAALLAFARVGTTRSERCGVSSEFALQRALVNLSLLIEDSGALVTYDSLPTVLADETQLIQLFQNLVSNAIRYRRPGIPEVHISAARSEQRWIFSVQDNGMGIDTQHFTKIFEMFQQTDKRKESGGVGIGLAICKKIVERHGGSISVESQLGQGSTFRFTFEGADGSVAAPTPPETDEGRSNHVA
jgi:PAS domain S-box-containing protein